MFTSVWWPKNFRQLRELDWKVAGMKPLATDCYRFQKNVYHRD